MLYSSGILRFWKEFPLLRNMHIHWRYWFFFPVVPHCRKSKSRRLSPLSHPWPLRQLQANPAVNLYRKKHKLRAPNCAARL